MGDIKYQNKNQWKLAHYEIYSEENRPSGWTDNSYTNCQGVYMLGGYGKFAGGEVHKIIKEIPQHQYIKIQATYHFIDEWQGQIAFLRADLYQNNNFQYLWTHKYDSSDILNGLNLCGNETPEGLFSKNIELEVPHSSNTLTIGIGSTLGDDPLKQSFGISQISIFIK